MKRSALTTRPHSASLTALALAAGTLLPNVAIAQTKPPVANYWMSVETTSGLPMGGAGGAPSMMDIGKMMFGAGGGAQRHITLQLGSQQPAGGTPSAEHVIPPALKMGAALPLESPRRAPAERREDVPQGFERPKGRMLIFWGCGDKVGPGQPVIIDFAKVAAGQWPTELFSRRVSLPLPPGPERNRTYGDWPNERDATRVPADARLAGDHVVKGNYSPEIRFALTEKHDFMEPVTFMGMTKSPGGGMRVIWKGVPNALGYYAGVMGSKQGTEDFVWWSSSDSREFGESLFSFVPPAEVNKLIRERVVMPPTTTECTVPAEVMAAAPAGMLRFIAYGDEVNFAHPPRPQDPKAPWNPEWVTKVRLKSTAMTMIGEGMERMPGAGASAEPEQQGAGDPLKQGVNKLKGLFGF